MRFCSYSLMFWVPQPSLLNVCPLLFVTQWSHSYKKFNIRSFLLSAKGLENEIWNSEVRKASYGLWRHKTELVQILTSYIIFRNSELIMKIKFLGYVYRISLFNNTKIPKLRNSRTLYFFFKKNILTNAPLSIWLESLHLGYLKSGRLLILSIKKVFGKVG